MIFSKTKVIFVFFALSCITLYGCNKHEPSIEVPQPPIVIPPGDVQVAAYYFPNWGPILTSEWASLRAAKPRFTGHLQPKMPVWGYTNENDPLVMAQKIDAAADNGINAFIFDWYYYDPGSNLISTDTNNDHWDGQKYLSKALENGFLNAANINKLKFALLWCNHDLGGRVKGAVTPATFEQIMDYVIEKYFKNPSYWKINGCPYFSIYQISTFLQTYGNGYAKARAALDLFRNKVKAAGFPDLHINGVLYGFLNNPNIQISALNLNSVTSYTWIHHYAMRDFPTTEYSKVADGYFNGVFNGGGANGLEKPASQLMAPYHINVSMGWDSSSRWGADAPKSKWGPVIVNNTPYLFTKYLAKAKEITMAKPGSERIITINSWNEWGEGSFLEPEIVYGTKYLEAIKAVFKQ